MIHTPSSWFGVHDRHLIMTVFMALVWNSWCWSWLSYDRLMIMFVAVIMAVTWSWRCLSCRDRHDRGGHLIVGADHVMIMFVIFSLIKLSWLVCPIIWSWSCSYDHVNNRHLMMIRLMVFFIWSSRVDRWECYLIVAEVWWCSSSWFSWPSSGLHGRGLVFVIIWSMVILIGSVHGRGMVFVIVSW